MSQVDKETIEVIAQSIGINNLSNDASLFLAPDVEYRIRELMQESIKCMRHSRRTTLTCDDVDSALSLKNVEPIYGFTSGGSSLRFKRAIGYRDLFYIDDKDIDFKDVIEAPLPKAPLDTSILCHWLAIDGVQPAIPENALLQVIVPPADNKGHDQKYDIPVDVRLPVKHVLSRELQLYFDKITELTLRKSDSVLFKEALKSLATDSGLHPLVPYFTYFIADEVSRGLNDYSVLFALMRVVRSLLQNPHINIEPYLHQLMPSVVSCLVAKRLGNRLADNHWELRDFAANLVALICKRFGNVYSSLQTRLTRTLLNAFLDPKKSLTQHYGAIQGLAAIGPNVVRLLLLPNLEPYLQLLEPEMLFDKQKNELKRYEAWRVYGVLLRAAGQCIYGYLKVLPPLPSPEASTVLRTSRKVITAGPNKLPENMGQLQQHPMEKLETNDQGNAAPSELSASPMQVDSLVPPPSSDFDPNSAISNEQAPIAREPSLPRAEKQKSNIQAINKSAAILSQVWKDDLKSRELMLSLLELFGERIPSFIPSSEMMLFL